MSAVVIMMTDPMVGGGGGEGNGDGGATRGRGACPHFARACCVRSVAFERQYTFRGDVFLLAGSLPPLGWGSVT